MLNPMSHITSYYLEETRHLSHNNSRLMTDHGGYFDVLRSKNKLVSPTPGFSKATSTILIVIEWDVNAFIYIFVSIRYN